MAVDELVTQLKTVWKFDYEPKIKALRELYEVAKKEQWNAATDVPWKLDIDHETGTSSIPASGACSASSTS